MGDAHVLHNVVSRVSLEARMGGMLGRSSICTGIIGSSFLKIVAQRGLGTSDAENISTLNGPS